MGQPKRKEPRLSTPSPTPTQIPRPPPEAAYGLSRTGWLILLGSILLINIPLIHRFLLRGEQPAPLSVPYQDDFSNPATVRENYWTTGGYWRVLKGELFSPGVKNNPLWLTAKLPADVAVEFDVRSQSPEGDIKVELFGDGLNHASGYVFIHGGWNNSMSIIARLDEHGVSLARLEQQATIYQPDTRMRVEANPYPVQQGQTYHWRIERKGPELRWLIDGQPFMSLVDPYPLSGKGHDRFGFSSWESDLYFDNLKIEPL